MLKDWEELCPIAFKARWFGTDEEKKLFSLDEVQVIRYGVLFEMLVVGTGMGGKKLEWTDKEKKSVYYERIKRQAKLCRDYLKSMGGSILAAQDYVQTSFEHEGVI